MSKLNPEMLQLLGAISLLPQTDQQELLKMKNEIIQVIQLNKDLGIIALTLVGLEYANVS